MALRIQKICFWYFFLITYPQTHYLQSLIYCFNDKFCVKILPILQALFQSAQHLYEKRERSRSVPLSNGSSSGRPKNIRIPQHWYLGKKWKPCKNFGICVTFCVFFFQWLFRVLCGVRGANSGRGSWVQCYGTPLPHSVLCLHWVSLSSPGEHLKNHTRDTKSSAVPWAGSTTYSALSALSATVFSRWAS